MYVTSKAGTEILKSQYEIIDSINGIPTIETDYSQLKHNHTEPMLMLSPAFNDKYIMVLKEQESVTESSRLRLTGVHSFIYDFSLDRIYEEYTRYFSLENILTLVFSDTEYQYEVSGSTRYNALDFENFGNNDKMSLINQICERWELEYRVKGNKVYFADQRGTKTTKQFRYKMNIHDSHVNLDISEGATYIRAYFGKKDEENPSNSTYVEKEMLHPLAEDFGVRHAKPYSNEVITQEETMQRYMKMKIEETWKLSVEIDVLDLSGDGSAEVGDEVWAIDERMDLKYKTRIVEKRDFYDVNDRIYRTKVVLGNKTFIEAVSAQEVTADDVESQVVKYYNQMIEQLKADFDNDFNAERDAFKAMLKQAKADIFTEIAADKDRMENILETMTEQWTEDFNQSVAESKAYAEQQAQEKASAVQSNLDSFEDSHQQLYDEVTGNILDIDTFLGDKSKTLKQQFDTVRTDFDTLQTDLDGVESDLTATKTDLQKQLDDARAELEGLEVGTRNLIPDSHFYGGSNNGWSNIYGTHVVEEHIWKKTYTRESGAARIERTFQGLEVGQTYTLTMYMKTDAHINWSGFVAAELIKSSDTAASEEYKIYSVTFEVTSDELVYIRGYQGSAKVGSYAHMDWFTLVRGNVSTTDWTPAPEDTEEKITTLNQQIEFIDGKLSAKLEQTDLLPINNKITEYGNTLTANAQSIQTLIDKSELHDDDITKWSNQTTANAEGIERRLTKAEYTTDKAALDADITKWSNLSTETAKGLERTIGRVSTAEGKLSNAELAIKANADSLKLTATKTEVENAIDGLDVGVRNLVIGSGESVSSNAYLVGVYTMSEPWKVGQEYSVLIKGEVNEGQVFGIWAAGTATQATTLKYDSEKDVHVSTFTLRSLRVQRETEFRIYNVSAAGAESANVEWVMMVKGNKAPTSHVLAPEDTDAKITKVSSDLEVEAGRIEGLVTDISKDYVKQSSVKVTSDRVTIGSTIVNGSTIGSVLSVSPTGIDAVAKAMRLSGDLYVDGDITSLAVDAIEGNFSRLFTSSLTTNVIKSNHIQTDTALAKKLFATNANIDELVTRTHFSNNIKTMSIDAVHADLRSVNSEIMTTNILKSDWIDVDNAIVNRIISRQFFTENAVIKAANIRDLTATDIKGGVLSSLNESMKFNLMSNHLEFNNDATIDFYSTKNAFRMFTDSSTSDPRDIIHALGTGTSRSGYGQMFLGGGHYDIDGTVKANDVGFAGLKLGGNSATLAGSKVLIGSGGDDGKDQFFEFDFTTSLSNRYAYFRPTNTSDNFVIGSSNRWFHSMFTWRLNGLRFFNPSGYIKMGFDNGSGDGASLRFYEDDIWFDRGGTFSLKSTISRANDSYNRINASNGILTQLQNLAGRVSALENK